MKLFWNFYQNIQIIIKPIEKEDIMLIINGHKFAKNDRNFVKTLFEKDGTAYGYYKRKKGV